ncbi:MAG: uroporphyrinogen decarboxylase family protein [Saccharofermentanales bacterium]
MALTRKERVINSLNHKESDIIPFHADFTINEETRLENYTGKKDYLADKSLHLHYTQYWGWPTEKIEGSEHFVDEFGVTWNRSGVDKDIGVIENPIIYEPDIKLWRKPMLDEKRLRSDFEEAIRTKEDRFVFPGIGFSMFERLWSLCGMEDALVDMVVEPEFTHELLDTICEYNLHIIDIANEYEFDGFYFGDDWGQQKGLIMGPANWREFIKPRMKRMYERAKKGGKYILQHSCGDVHEIFPDLIDIGLDCYQTFQPEIYDIEAIKKEFGNSLSFWGGISTQQLLPYATPDKIRSETARIMRIMGKNGGYIAAPTHAVPGDVPPENIIAMLDVFMNQDKYL